MRDSDDMEDPSAEAPADVVSVPDWQAIVDTIDASIGVFDTDNRLIAWNKGFAETAGLPKLDLHVGMAQVDVIRTLAERGIYGEGDPKVLAENRLAEIHANRAAGHDEEFILAGRPVKRERYYLTTGELIAFTRHIDRRRNVEQELETKSAILQAVFDNLDQPVCVWDSGQRLVASNDKFAELTGMDPSVVSIGMHSREFILSAAKSGYLGKGDPVELAEARYSELWNSTPPEHEVLHRSGGRTFDVHRGRLPDGGVVSIYNEVTDRVRAAEELRQAKAQAENANAVKSDFLANMSHELRTPLNAIIGFSEMMMHSRFDDPARYQEYAGDIRGSAELLLNIINDLLDLSRIEAGKTEFRLMMLDIRECVDTCLELVQRTEGAQRLTLENQVPSDIPSVQLDENFLRQALLNLLSNAVKATPDGGRITVHASLVGDGRFELSVEDTGVGMPPEMLDTVFNPYDSSGNSYVRKEKGTGLGLAIVKRLVEMLRGEVSIESTPGNGTTVRLNLPVSFTNGHGPAPY